MRRILVGSDHAGLALKLELVEALRGWGVEVEDLGYTPAAGEAPRSVDYPDYGLAVARAVAEGQAPLGLLVCGSGIGMSIVANKVVGIRAALCADPYSARACREHNDANVICIGGRTIGPELAKVILRAFLDGEFCGGRHAQRVDKIRAAER